MGKWQWSAVCRLLALLAAWRAAMPAAMRPPQERQPSAPGGASGVAWPCPLVRLACRLAPGSLRLLRLSGGDDGALDSEEARDGSAAGDYEHSKGFDSSYSIDDPMNEDALEELIRGAVAGVQGAVEGGNGTKMPYAHATPPKFCKDDVEAEARAMGLNIDEIMDDPKAGKISKK